MIRFYEGEECAGDGDQSDEMSVVLISWALLLGHEHYDDPVQYIRKNQPYRCPAACFDTRRISHVVQRVEY